MLKVPYNKFGLHLHSFSLSTSKFDCMAAPSCCNSLICMLCQSHLNDCHAHAQLEQSPASRPSPVRLDRDQCDFCLLIISTCEAEAAAEADPLLHGEWQPK